MKRFSQNFRVTKKKRKLAVTIIIDPYEMFLINIKTTRGDVEGRYTRKLENLKQSKLNFHASFKIITSLRI